MTPALAKNIMANEGMTQQLTEDRIPRQFYWFAVIALLILGSIGYQAWRVKKPDPEIIVEEIKVEQKATIDPLAPAKAALQQGNIISFYHELEKTIWSSVINNCDVLPSSLNKQNVSSVLATKGVDPQTIQLLKEVLNECEWALYVPSHETRDAENLLARAASIIEKIDPV